MITSLRRTVLTILMSILSNAYHLREGSLKIYFKTENTVYSQTFHHIYYASNILYSRICIYIEYVYIEYVYIECVVN